MPIRAPELSPLTECPSEAYFSFTSVSVTPLITGIFFSFTRQNLGGCQISCQMCFPFKWFCTQRLMQKKTKTYTYNLYRDAVSVLWPSHCFKMMSYSTTQQPLHFNVSLSSFMCCLLSWMCCSSDLHRVCHRQAPGDEEKQTKEGNISWVWLPGRTSWKKVVYKKQSLKNNK